MKKKELKSLLNWFKLQGIILVNYEEIGEVILPEVCEEYIMDNVIEDKVLEAE